MALQHSMVLESGIELPEAYSRIEEFFYAKHGQVGLQVAHYANVVAANTPGVQPVRVDPYTIRDVDIYDDEGEVIIQPSQFQAFFTLSKMNPSGKNPISQGYAYLKSLPEFAGAVDV